MLKRAKRASHIDPPASSYAIMRRARPYRGENPAPGKNVEGELDPTAGIREQPRPTAVIARTEILQCSSQLPFAGPSVTGEPLGSVVSNMHQRSMHEGRKFRLMACACFGKRLLELAARQSSAPDTIPARTSAELNRICKWRARSRWGARSRMHRRLSPLKT